MRDKSDENWRVGCNCLKEGNCNSAANRLYYSLLQAALTYLTEKKRYTQPGDGKVHGEVIRLMSGESEGSTNRYILGKFKGWRAIADYKKNTPPKAGMEQLLSQAAMMREKYLREAGV